jgi:hypothetical protein
METTTTIFADLLSFPDGTSEAVAVIRNYGDEPLVVDTGGSSAPFFVAAADPPFGTPIPSGGSVRVTIRFAPEKPGAYARLLSLGGTAFLCEASTEVGENDREWITSMPPRSSPSRTTNRSRRSWLSRGRVPSLPVVPSPS